MQLVTFCIFQYFYNRNNFENFCYKLLLLEIATNAQNFLENKCHLACIRHMT